MSPLVGRFYGVFFPFLNEFGNIGTSLRCRTLGTNPAGAWSAFLRLHGGTRAEWNKKGYRAKPFVLYCEQRVVDEAAKQHDVTPASPPAASTPPQH